MYHQTSFDEYIIRNIYHKGLIPHECNEGGYGIWFNIGTPFYDIKPSTVCFSVNYDENFRNKHQIDRIMNGENGKIVLVKDTIKYNELILESCPFCIDIDKGKVCLYGSKDEAHLSLFKKLSEKENCSPREYILNKIQNNKYNFLLNSDKIIFYSDVFEYFFGGGSLAGIDLHPKIEIKQLFK